MHRRYFLERTGAGVAGALSLAGCTEHTLEAAETRPPFLDAVDVESIDLPVEDRLDVVAAGIRAGASAEVADLDGLERYLVDRDIEVADLAERRTAHADSLEIEREDVDVVRDRTHGDRRVLELSYGRPDLAATGVLRDVGLVAGGYAALVNAGYEADLLEATVLDAEGSAYGSFHVLTAWAEEYLDDHVTVRRYGGKAVATVASE